MLVRCPSCGHSRDINPEKIPARAEFATCPKCSHRFRFRAVDPVDAPEEVPAPETHHKDIWDAVDSLHERWKREDSGERPAGHEDRRENDREDERPSRDLGRLEEYAPEENQGFDRTNEMFIPWEKPRELGVLSSFYRTVLMVLLHPARFFSGISSRPPLAQALLFYILFGLIQSSANMFWWHVALQSSVGASIAAEIPPQMLDSMDISRLPFMLLTAPLILSLYQFIMSGLIHVMLRLVEPGKANFVKTFKIVGYASAAMVFAVVPFLGFLLAPLGYLVVLLAGCRYAYGFSWARSIIILIPPYILFFLLTVGQAGVTM